VPPGFYFRDLIAAALADYDFATVGGPQGGVQNGVAIGTRVGLDRYTKRSAPEVRRVSTT
jgi:hypothetical protein